MEHLNEIIKPALKKIKKYDSNDSHEFNKSIKIPRSKWSIEVQKYKKSNDVILKNQIGTFDKSCTFEKIKFHKSSNVQYDYFNIANSQLKQPKCIQIKHELHINAIVTDKNINNYIKNIRIEIGENNIDSMCGDQLIASLILCNKKFTYVKTETGTTTIMPLCFSIFENYLPLALLSMHTFNIFVDHHYQHVDFNIFATNVTDHAIIPDHLCHLTSEHIIMPNNHHDYKKINMDNGIIKINLIVSGPIYVIYIKGLDYKNIINIQLSTEGEFMHNSIKNNKQVSLKYEQFMEDGVIIPMSDKYFEQINNDNTCDHEIHDSSCYNLDVIITMFDNTNTYKTECMLDVYYERYNVMMYHYGICVKYFSI